MHNVSIRDNELFQYLSDHSICNVSETCPYY